MGIEEYICIWCGGVVEHNPFFKGKFSIEVCGETERYHCKGCGRFMDGDGIEQRDKMSRYVRKGGISSNEA